MKKFRMPISKTFPATHPKAGQPTWFRIGIRTGDKQHTIRCNYSYWNNIAQKVNTGEAIIVYYEWDAKPYNSKTTDLFTSTKMYLSKLEFADPGGVTSYNNVLVKCFIDDKPFAIPFNIIAENDYFENPHDFYDWFAGDFTKTFALNCFNKPAHEIYKKYKV